MARTSPGKQRETSSKGSGASRANVATARDAGCDTDTRARASAAAGSHLDALLRKSPADATT